VSNELANLALEQVALLQQVVNALRSRVETLEKAAAPKEPPPQAASAPKFKVGDRVGIAGEDMRTGEVINVFPDGIWGYETRLIGSAAYVVRTKEGPDKTWPRIRLVAECNLRSFDDITWLKAMSVPVLVAPEAEGTAAPEKVVPVAVPASFLDGLREQVRAAREAEAPDVSMNPDDLEYLLNLIGHYEQLQKKKT